MISVVIPTHNRCNLLKRAVDSVLCQSYRDIELIVVSDGSADETSEIMQEYVAKDNRVRYVHYNDSRGANYARNLGIRESKGEYIAFLDDDDEWFPLKLDKQISVFDEDQSIGLVYTAICVVQQDNGTHYLSIPKAVGKLGKEILLHNCITTTSTVVVKRSILEKAGGFDEQLPAKQDYDLWIRCLQITDVGCVKEPLINYYVSRNSNQISSSVERYVKANEIIDNKYKEIICKLTDKERRMRNAIKCLDLAKIALKNDNSGECRKYCLEAIKYKFSASAIFLFFASLFSYNFISVLLQKIRQ